MCALVFAAFWVLPLSDAHAANPSEAFVQSSIDRAYTILNDGASDAAQRQLKFRALLLSVVDVKRVALFTLGPFARDAGEADLQKYIAACTDLLVAVYQRGLDTYKDHPLEVIGSVERAEDDVIVNVVAGGPGGKAAQTQMGFRVRRAQSGGNIITDIEVEGAWLAITQREEFMAYLQQHGGNVAALSMELEERAARLRGADEANRIP